MFGVHVARFWWKHERDYGYMNCDAYRNQLRGQIRRAIEKLALCVTMFHSA
jgi:hypothetical protein